MSEREMADVVDIDHFGQYPVLAARGERGSGLGLLGRRAAEDQGEAAIAGQIDQRAGESDMGEVGAQADAGVGRGQQAGEAGGCVALVSAEFEVEQADASGSRGCSGSSGVRGISWRYGEYVETVVKHCRSPVFHCCCHLTLNPGAALKIEPAAAWS